jgi:hypothetical protein
VIRWWRRRCLTEQDRILLSAVLQDGGMTAAEVEHWDRFYARLDTVLVHQQLGPARARLDRLVAAGLLEPVGAGYLPA